MSQTPPSLPHQPVMATECLHALTEPVCSAASAAQGMSSWVIDGTFGAGGHTKALLDAGLQVIAIDRDHSVERYLTPLQKDYGTQLAFVKGNFCALDTLAMQALATNGQDTTACICGVLLDIGVSSMQLDQPERGFAFRQDGPLDMRMDQHSDAPSAADVVNTYPEAQLAALIFKYGEERYSRRIAQAIVNARSQTSITTTTQLRDVVQAAYPKGQRRDHPARRTFQALRIYVNDELGALEKALHAAERILAPDGRLVVLSYHSLEDRIVKTFMRNRSLKSLYKKPLTASAQEIASNPRARSAKLRIAHKPSRLTTDEPYPTVSRNA